jgi:hypothetical protein
MVSPCAIKTFGGHRLFYTEVLPRPGFPAGCLDYENSTARICCADSDNDGETWTQGRPVLLPEQAGALRVVSPEVVNVHDTSSSGASSGLLRMYFESAEQATQTVTSIRSALSSNGGLDWEVEDGARLGGGPSDAFSSCRVVLASAESIGAKRTHESVFQAVTPALRMFASQRDVGIVSALSTDGGLTFAKEEGVRISIGATKYSSLGVFAPEVLQLADSAHTAYRMYYVGVSGVVKAGAANRCSILTATSEDGLAWTVEEEAVVLPAGGGAVGEGGGDAGAVGEGGGDGRGAAVDRAKCSEMSVMALSKGGHRMLYEACDGTAPGERGVWRIASVVASATASVTASAAPAVIAHCIAHCTHQYLFPAPDDGDRLDPLGHVVYEDGASYTFYSETQLQLYLCDDKAPFYRHMPGPMFDAGEYYATNGCTPEPAAIAARRLHESAHGTASVFLFHEDYISGMAFPLARPIAEEQMQLPARERRGLGGLATATARISTGGPAPRPAPR